MSRRFTAVTNARDDLRRIVRVGSKTTRTALIYRKSCKQNDVSVFWCTFTVVKLGCIKATRSAWSPCPVGAVSRALEADELCGWSFPYSIYWRTSLLSSTLQKHELAKRDLSHERCYVSACIS